MSISIETLQLPKVPFRGLSPFRFIDHSIFFARESEMQKLLRLITVYRAVLLYGDSGTGKSSLVRAGLIPNALSDEFLPETLRIQPRLGEEFVVERILCDEGENPKYLPSNLVSDGSSPRSVLSAEQFTARIRAISSDRTPLFILDQFEEWVTLADSSGTQSAEDTHRAQDRILDALAGLMRDHSVPVKFLFVFREDYLAKLNRLFYRCPNLVDQYLRLTPLPTTSLPRIVRGPFTLSDTPGKHWGSEISASLAEQIREEIEARGNSFLNLSEIQVVCLRLWASGNPDDLFRQRKIAGILEDFLASSLADLGPLEGPAVALLSRMVTASGTRNVVSRDDLLDRVKREGGPARSRLTKALDALVDDTRLVNKEIRNEIFFYEIVSEFLVPWIFQQKLKLGAKAARKKFTKRLLLGTSLSLLLLAALAAWYREKNTTAARLSAIVQELEASKNEADHRLNLSLDKDSFMKDADTRRRVAESERDSLKAQLSASQTEKESLKAELSTLQSERDSLNAKIFSLQRASEDLTNKLMQSEDARKKAETKVASLQSEMDKSKLPSNETPPPSPQNVDLVLEFVPSKVAHEWFGRAADHDFSFIQVQIRNRSAWDLQIDDVAVMTFGKSRIDPVTKLPVASDSQLAKFNNMCLRKGSVIRGHSTEVKIVAIPITRPNFALGSVILASEYFHRLENGSVAQPPNNQFTIRGEWSDVTIN